MRNKQTIRKGDVVKHYNDSNMHYSNFAADYQTGIVLSIRKKEVSRNKSKHVIELVIATTADIMWDSGDIESGVPIETLSLLSKG